MKKSAIKDLKTKTDAELNRMLSDTRSELSKIMVQHKAGKLKDVMLVKRKKQDIARILTILRQEKLSGPQK